MTKASVTNLLRIGPGPVLLRSHDPRATPGFSGDKAAGKRALAELGDQISDLQVQIASFKAPTAAEKARGFLWRIRQRVPGPGMIGIFDRSHYEDVLIARVRKLAAPSTIGNRYESINHFEADLVDDGTSVLKCFLHISAREQRDRLMARLDDPTKHWKFNPGDIDERARWNDYQRAYEIALERCNTEVAPWLVIPSDRKWYRNWAITRILLEHLTMLDPRWPPADFDVAEQKARLAAT
jgi:PPK2 family polyphosphate:nucleotide phosphotransferase